MPCGKKNTERHSLGRAGFKLGLSHLTVASNAQQPRKVNDVLLSRQGMKRVNDGECVWSPWSLKQTSFPTGDLLGAQQSFIQKPVGDDPTWPPIHSSPSPAFCRPWKDSEPTSATTFWEKSVCSWWGGKLKSKNFAVVAEL